MSEHKISCTSKVSRFRLAGVMSLTACHLIRQTAYFAAVVASILLIRNLESFRENFFFTKLGFRLYFVCIIKSRARMLNSAKYLRDWKQPESFKSRQCLFFLINRSALEQRSYCGFYGKTAHFKEIRNRRGQPLCFSSEILSVSTRYCRPSLDKLGVFRHISNTFMVCQF